MQINIDPMVMLRAKAVDKINARYMGIAMVDLHRRHVHAIKRDLAEGHLTGQPAGILEQEAEIRGVDVSDLIQQIIANAAQEDPALAHELERQRLLAAVRGAADPEALQTVMSAADFQTDEAFRPL